jgi:hypothetical protein
MTMPGGTAGYFTLRAICVILPTIASSSAAASIRDGTGRAG